MQIAMQLEDADARIAVWNAGLSLRRYEVKKNQNTNIIIVHRHRIGLVRRLQLAELYFSGSSAHHK
jgi:hypothetical protein